MQATNFERITVNPNQMGGVPCIRGLRIPVATVLRMLAGGMTEQQILADYPDLQQEDIRECLRFAAASAMERDTSTAAARLKFLDRHRALSPAIARLLAKVGHDSVHVRDYGLHAAEDSVILDRAGTEDRVVVSADFDFAMLLALSRRDKPSFILFREADIVRPQDYASRLLECLSILEAELDAGCVVTFRRGRIRVRTLPISVIRAIKSHRRHALHSHHPPTPIPHPLNHIPLPTPRHTPAPSRYAQSNQQ